MNNTRYICTTAIDIAIYCALSMSMRIPLGIGHIAVDLGYMALAVYAYNIGGISAAIVGGGSAAIGNRMAIYLCSPSQKKDNTAN